MFRGMAKICLTRLIKDVVIPHFDVLAQDRVANHVLQDLIANVRTEKQLNQVLSVAQGKLLHLMSIGRAGIVLQVCKKALVYTSVQQPLLDSLKEEADESNANFIVTLVLGSTTHNLTTDEMNRSIRQVSYLHSMILQNLLQFEDTSHICSCLDILPINHRICLVCSKFGSHVIDTLNSSKTVNHKFKRNFIDSLRAVYPTMITDVYGSKVFDTFWNDMSVPCKKEVMEVLAKSVAPIMGSAPGKCVARNIQLQDYMHNKELWDKWLVEENKARKLKKSQKSANDSPMPSPEKKRKSSDSELTKKMKTKSIKTKHQVQEDD